jgi:hypothetical protein
MQDLKNLMHTYCHITYLCCWLSHQEHAAKQVENWKIKGEMNIGMEGIIREKA